ncbi:MAG: DUF362 domain-containing protein [Candidatus Bathyarchaeota archaeon]|jgi:uncharacterized protein (DUF362 family)|nr:DUF362 domain-containing protein [Candidatus Bathyarchaeota archaeon]
MKESTVALVTGERGFDPVYQALDLINFTNVLKNCSRVLIKVNFITDKTWDTGATTDPLVVEAIIHKLRPYPVEVLVVESDATMTNADKAFTVTGMKAMCEAHNIEWINLRKIHERTTLSIPQGETLKSITVPTLVVDSAIISAAKLKTHTSTGVTLGMKNMFGLLPDKLKFKYHAKGISKVIVDINTVLKPIMTVIDGFIAMEGAGPTRGDPVTMNTILAGTDPVATDATGCRVMNIDPHTIRHIQLAADKGLGNIDQVNVVGASLDTVTRPFKAAR